MKSVTSHKSNIHIRKRFVERIWGMQPLDSYIQEKENAIDRQLDELLEGSKLMFKKPYAESIRAYYYNEKNNIVIVTDDKDAVYVTLFEPKMLNVPSGFRKSNIALGMALEIEKEYNHLAELEEEAVRKSEDIDARQATIQETIEKLQKEASDLTNKRKLVWLKHDKARGKVYEMGQYFVGGNPDET